jgi:hypothetical protein
VDRRAIPTPDDRKYSAYQPQARTMTVIEYKGYRIEVSSVGRGWRASIYSPGSTAVLSDSPSNLEKSPQEAIVAEAKKVIDVRINKQAPFFG